MRAFIGFMPEKLALAATLETNRQYPEIMNEAPPPFVRAVALATVADDPDIERHITAEPILDFDLDEFVRLIKLCNPVQVNIGADSGNNRLPEPPPEKIAALIEALRPFTKVYLKPNLKRLYREEV
jgi:hypothetical protein